MDAIGDYLYLIVFLGIVVINILKNLRKQKTVVIPDFSGNHPASEENEGKEFWENSYPSSHQEPVAQIQRVERRKDVENSSLKSGLKKKHTDNFKEKEENNNPAQVTFNSSEDARRAFIYSEIWNRKY